MSLHSGQCHCGTVRFEVDLPDGFASARRCDCSFCRRRGAVVVSTPLSGFRLLQGAEALTRYQFGTQTAEHWFCARCGIYTHHRRRSNPLQLGVNVACLDGVNPRDLDPVIWVDGVNHPSDRQT